MSEDDLDPGVLQDRLEFALCRDEVPAGARTKMMMMLAVQEAWITKATPEHRVTARNYDAAVVEELRRHPIDPKSLEQAVDKATLFYQNDKK